MIKKRLSPNQLAEVKANFAGLKQIGGYSPLNAEYKVSAIESIENRARRTALAGSASRRQSRRPPRPNRRQRH
jgi:hypothetical protein